MMRQTAPEAPLMRQGCSHATARADAALRAAARAPGCLPTLATIPVFWGLYRALSNASSDGALTGGFYWLPDLAGPTSLAAQKAGARPLLGLGVPGNSTFSAPPSRQRREAPPGLRCAGEWPLAALRSVAWLAGHGKPATGPDTDRPADQHAHRCGMRGCLECHPRSHGVGLCAPKARVKRPSAPGFFERQHERLTAVLAMAAAPPAETACATPCGSAGLRRQRPCSPAARAARRRLRARPRNPALP
jgi:hypothetical protein